MNITNQPPDAWHAGVGAHTFYAKTKEDLLETVSRLFKCDPDWIEPLFREVSAAKITKKHVMSALALAPTDMSHPARCQWIADTLTENLYDPIA